MVASFRNRALLIGLVLCCMVGGAIPVRAGDDTARFYGTWKISFPVQRPDRNADFSSRSERLSELPGDAHGKSAHRRGQFFRRQRQMDISAAAPNNGGTYRFTSATSAVCTNNAGQTVTWRRENGLPTAFVAGAGTDPAPLSQLRRLRNGKKPDTKMTNGITRDQSASRRSWRKITTRRGRPSWRPRSAEIPMAKRGSA